MTTQEFVNNAYLRLNGKIPTFAAGTAKYNAMLAIGNMQISVWENEDDWNSLYNPAFSVGAVTATDTFPLGSTVNYISAAIGDVVKITRLDGTVDRYFTVPAEILSQHTGNYCAKIGQNLKFAQAFKTTDPQFGGAITAPVYLHAAILVNTTDVVPVDDANWLCVASAAQAASSSIVKASMYANLMGEANSLMANMKYSNASAQNVYMQSPSFLRATEW